MIVVSIDTCHEEKPSMTHRYHKQTVLYFQQKQEAFWLHNFISISSSFYSSQLFYHVDVDVLSLQTKLT